MGPGAGTAIVNGVGMGFANALPRGPVGIVSAAGQDCRKSARFWRQTVSGFRRRSAQAGEICQSRWAG